METAVEENHSDHIAKQVRGWALPYLVMLDELPGIGVGRWAYWLRICETGELPDDPIPQVEFRSAYSGQGDMPWTNPYPDQLTEHPYEHVREILKIAVVKGHWYDDAWLMLVHWLLHGFGVPDMQRHIDAIPEEIRNAWYERLNIAYLMTLPIDWSATILQNVPRWMGRGQAKWAKSTAFYSTPMNVCIMMTQMSFMPASDEADQPIDFRTKTVCDPFCGTGSMLLPASNYSLRLFGMDIVQDLVYCTMLNGFLFAPWMVCNPPSIRAMWKRIDPEPVAIPEPLALETDPVRVAEIQAERERQYAFFEQVGAPDPQTPQRQSTQRVRHQARTENDLQHVQQSLFSPRKEGS